jgi:ferric-dicitrate binding protein FerR (iron transport regulator)
VLVIAATTGLIVVSRRQAPVHSGARTYAAGIGERVSITLTDGTQIELAPASRLEVPSTYGKTGRTVMLEGEAFFRVSHDAHLPFEVKAENAVAVDIGTSFDVRAYRDEPTVSVAVSEGRVSLQVSGDDQRRALAAHDVAAVDRSGSARVTHGEDPAPFTAWAAGDLVYRDTPAAIVIADLRRWYGIDVEVADANLSGRRLTVRFDRGESIDQVGDVLRALLGAHATIRVAREAAASATEGH